MTNQELTAFIKLLLDCGKALVQLAEHLDSLDLDFLRPENSHLENSASENQLAAAPDSANSIPNNSKSENPKSENQIMTISAPQNDNFEDDSENVPNNAKTADISEKSAVANDYEQSVDNSEANSDIQANIQKLAEISEKTANSNSNDDIIISDNQNTPAKQNTSAPEQNQIVNSNNAPFAKLFAGLAANQNQGKQPAFNPLQMLGKLTNLGNLGNLGGQNGTNALGGLANLANLGGLGGLANMGNLAGIGSKPLPTTLAELHDNPQLLGMLNNVAENPQMLNMLATLTGQDANTLQSALRSLQPTDTSTAAAAEATEAAETAAPNPTQAQTASAAADILRTSPGINAGNLLSSLMQSSQTAAPGMQTPPMQNMANVPQTPTAHLDSLLAEWHWQPYARAWIS